MPDRREVRKALAWFPAPEPEPRIPIATWATLRAAAQAWVDSPSSARTGLDPSDPNTMARSTDPDTSKKAARLNPGGRSSQRRRILETIAGVWPASVTWEIVAMMTGIEEPWKRISELHGDGLIEVAGEAVTSRGADAQLYRVSAEGRRVLGVAS